MAMIAYGKVLMIGTQDEDIVLKFQVKGTYWPPRLSNTTTFGSNVSFYAFNTENKLFINFNDGTGEHEYDFKTDGNLRRVYFRSKDEPTVNPNELFLKTSTFDAGGYFYQDLPAEVKGTVDATYEHFREIYIRIQYPQNVTNLYMLYTPAYGTLPSSLGKLRMLDTLSLFSLRYISFFIQDFYRSAIRQLLLSDIGDVMNNGFPKWILNSYNLSNINLQNSINLSGDPITKRLSEIDNIKDSLEILNLNSTMINYKLPKSIGNLYKLKALTINDNTSPYLRLPDNFDNITESQNLSLSLRNTRMPLSEIERILTFNNVRVLRIETCQYSTDFTIDFDNFFLKELSIGGSNNWDSGIIPSFIMRLKGLEILHMEDQSSSSSFINLKYWRDLTGATSLSTIYLCRISNFETTIPSFFDNATALKTLYIYASFQNSGGVDTWINNFYDKVTTVASMSSGNTLLRNMTVSQVSSNVIDMANTTRPSGTYQQPSGYVQGSNNGSPASPLERVWVLVNQYGHSWQLKP